MTTTAHPRPPWEPASLMRECGHQHGNAEELANWYGPEDLAAGLADALEPYGASVVMKPTPGVAAFAVVPFNLRRSAQPVWGGGDEE